MSDDDQGGARVEAGQVLRVRGDNRLAGSTSTDNDVCVNDVRSAAGGKQPPDAGGVDTIERHHIGGRLSNQASEAGLTVRLSNRLAQRCSRDGHGAVLCQGATEQDDDSSIIAIECDEASSIERDSDGHAADRLRRFGTPNAESAQAASSAVIGPPVSFSAWASMAPQPATSSSDTATAC